MSNMLYNLCKQAFQPGDRVVAAVSGGADSMCLAHILSRIASELEIALLIAHVNHQLRGEAAEADAQYVCRWASNQGLPRALLRISIRHQGGESIQTAAREQRYEALLKTCHSFRANKLATAHHADDQVETFLINLIRGSGGRGLQGIPRQRQLDQGTMVIRPLLDITRREIEVYCRNYGIEWREDRSNSSLDYQRNRIRHQLLPQLRSFNSGIDQVLLNTINNLSLDQQVLSELATEYLAKTEVSSPLSFAPRALAVSKLRKIHPSMQNRLVQELLPRGYESRHIRAVLNLLEEQTGTSIDLPGNHRAYRLHDSIAVGGLPVDSGFAELSLSIPGQTQIPGGQRVIIETKQFPGSQVFWVPEHIDHILVGPRRSGDYFYHPGGGKKLKDYMIDQKVPRWLRGAIPILRTDTDILWVAGLARDRRSADWGEGKKPIYIKIETIGGSHGKQDWRNIAGPTDDSSQGH